MFEIENVQDYTKTLEEEGVVVIPNYITEEKANELFSKIKNEITSGNIREVTGSQSYETLIKENEPLFNKRSGRDEGMIDVFNMDLALKDLQKFKEDKSIKKLINSTSKKSYTADNLNVYWNRSVTTTRDFHADTYSGKYKSFLYLTDVSDLSDGPFSYIPGSHNTSYVTRWFSQKINRLLGNPSTDAIFYNSSRKTCFTGEAGTLIIANQAGYHRGHPQDEGSERMLLTTSYTPE